MPLTDTFGAEVFGCDPSRDLDEAAGCDLRQAWLDHNLLLFRNVEMIHQEQVTFTRRFGPLHIMSQTQYNHPDNQEIFVISNAKRNGRPAGMRRVGLGWHTDGEDKVRPNAGSLLYAHEVPPEGGDTLYASMYAAYDALPPTTKARIEGRKARFSRVALHHVHYPEEPLLSETEIAARPDVFHPLVRTHPASGRKSIYIGRWACGIVGMPDDDATILLKELMDFATQDAFVYSHSWRAGDALLWDNRCTMHCATPYDEVRYRRHMHRTTLEGDIPF